MKISQALDGGAGIGYTTIGWIGKTLPSGTGTGRRKKYDYIKWMLPGFMLIVR